MTINTLTTFQACNCGQHAFIQLTCNYCKQNTCHAHLTTIDNERLCTNCMSQVVGECEECNEIHILRQDTPNQKICIQCSEDYLQCDRCGEYHDPVDIHSDDSIVLCDHCYDNYYFTCESCSSICHTDQMRSLNCDDSACYCESCADSHHEYCEECNGTGNAETLADHANQLRNNGASAILDYHPDIELEPIQHYIDDSSRMIGIELEIEHKRLSNMSDTCRYLGKELSGKVILTHDGSLSITGYEIVTVPMTYHAYKHVEWHKILPELSKLGAISHDSENCGLHIHLSNEWFYYNNDQKVIDVTKRYQILFCKLQGLLIRFSRRNDDQISRYCAFNIGSSSRYSAVNLTNSNTVEIRLWRGTLKPDSFNACIDMTFAILDFTYAHSCAHLWHYTQVNRVFKTWLKTSRYHKLVKYLIDMGVTI